MEGTSKPRRDFPAFPFEPYSIQIDFMSFLYDSLDKGGVAMLESPTGTGKTLSIICSALQWFVDHRKRQQQPCKKTSGTPNIGDGDEEPDWMRDFVVTDAQPKEEKRGKPLGFGNGDAGKKTPLSVIDRESKGPEGLTGDDDVEFLLDDYESEEDGWVNGCRGSKRKDRRCLDSSSSDDDDEEEKETSTKVYFTSRTHSQLSQFVKEFKRTVFVSELNIIGLGSRKNLCINLDVLKLGNGNRINERCLELQRSRSNSKIKIEELGRFIANLVAIVPEGMIVFFSSFEYEEHVHSAWKASGILPKILKKKRLFREPRSNMDVEVVLREYKESINSSSRISKADLETSGAILLAVVGGKISEGINFSDGMGRCVIMVGLPYPSLFDVELIERIKHIEGLGETSQTTSRDGKFNSSESVQSGFDILRSCKQRGKEYYENLCMKAVNQSIGRAIRHINDYAAVLLVDSRYSCSSSYQNFSRATDKLPLWIRDQLVFVTGSYGEVHRLLFQFYQHNRQ